MDPQEPAGDSHAVNIASLAQELREEPAGTNSSAQLVDGTRPCPITITEVGIRTRSVSEEEYDPHHVAIGPYHRSKSAEHARDDEKKWSLRAVLSAASPGTTEETYIEELVRLEPQARTCYEHGFGFTSTEFVRMLLLDACYLLVLFGGIDKYAGGRRRSDAASTATANGHVQGGYNSSSAPLVSSAGGRDKLKDVAVVRDAFYLAENQIPFFVIEKIHQQSILEAGVSAADMITGYIRKLFWKLQYSVATPNVAEPPGPGNLLHLLHMHFKPTVPSSSTGSALTSSEPVGRWRTATEYYFAGVKFKKRLLSVDGAQSILDVRLNGGSTLELPCLNIDAETLCILRNLMALEQRNPETTGSHVTAYCVFMSQLACTPSDVELLSRRGVISHGLGNHGEVAGFFTNLCKGVVFDTDDESGNYLKATSQALEKRFQSRWQRWLMWLRQKYFRNPWLAVGLAAGAFGLICAVVQAVYSVLSYKN